MRNKHSVLGRLVQPTLASMPDLADGCLKSAEDAVVMMHLRRAAEASHFPSREKLKKWLSCGNSKSSRLLQLYHDHYDRNGKKRPRNSESSSSDEEEFTLGGPSSGSFGG